MKLFSFRMRATSVFIFDTGMSTRRCFDPQALRMRVSMSAIGSVMLMEFSLPAGFANAGNHSRQRQFSEADAAEPEATQVGLGAAAAVAAALPAHLELGLELG